MHTQQKSPMPVVLVSIPLSRDLKRYFWQKFCWLRAHNGAKYAAEVFKTLRQVVLQYVDDVSRRANIEEYVAQCPVRKNGWLRKLFAYADTQPLRVLQFLKLYTVLAEPVVTAEEAAAAMDASLKQARPVGQPVVLLSWLWVLTHKSEWKRIIHRTFDSITNGDKVPEEADDEVLDSVHVGTWNFVWRLTTRGNTRKDVVRKAMGYWESMLRILTPHHLSEDAQYEHIVRSLPTLASYKRFAERPLPDAYGPGGVLGHWEGDKFVAEENPMEADALSLLSLAGLWPEVDIIIDVLPEGLQEMVDYVDAPDYLESIDDEGNPVVTDQAIVGHIRQIPKSGTVVRRSIADPNKFLQAGLEPYRRLLRSMTHKVPRNCQFDQGKLNHQIETELTYGYAGSVDLHQATDWLPLSWFTLIESTFQDSWFPTIASSEVMDGEKIPVSPVLSKSRGLFYRLARATWDNEGLESRWLRGQPLGTTPSFEILTLTHFCVLEALSFFLGRFDSPYALLGDDVVFFDEAVRESYISLMQGAGSPLSLHKSYSGRLTEFAGVIHVMHQHPYYCTDIPMLGWSNLFDYQRSTGIVVHYRNLPKEVKTKLRRISDTYQHRLRPEDLYTAMQLCAGVEMDTHIVGKILENPTIGDLVVNYYQAEEELDPNEPLRPYGFLINGTVGLYDQEVRLPTIRRKADWWIKKVRPESTTSIARRCISHH